MFINCTKICHFVGATVLASTIPVSAIAQHVHGVVEVGVVVENDTVAVSLNAPLSDVVGFEHAPDNDEQTASIAKAAALLADADRMFGLTVAASCVVTDVAVDGPDYMDPTTIDNQDHDNDHDSNHDHDDDHDHDTDHDDHDHEEASASAEHDHDTDHDDHDHDEATASADHDHDHDESGHDDHDHEGDQHAEVLANYEWTCANVEDLAALELRFSKGFASIEEINVQVLTAAGAQVATADASTESVLLTAP